MIKSYYDILGVEESANKTQIKNQYKKLVKIYHPDINSSFEAEFIFKEINKAAQILLNDKKRKDYDLLRKNNKKIYRPSSNKYSFDDLFKKTKKEENKPIKGDDIFVSVEIDYKEALLGTYRVVNIANSTICPKCQGKKFANNSICSYCNGVGEKIDNKKITVKIPANLKNKAKLRIKNEGQKGAFGGKNGDLYVVVNIQPKDEFTIKDGIVYVEVKISPYTAVLGGNVSVLTLWGEATIKIPPLTKTNQSFKLVNVGILNEKTNKKGDQIVTLIVETPSKVTDEEFRLYEKLKEINQKKKNAKIIN